MKISYLGFRSHGVVGSGEVMSVQKRIEEALGPRFPHHVFKMRFASRTDAMVSALENYVLLMAEEEIGEEALKKTLERLPPDIRVLEVRAVHENFTLLSVSKKKEYHYYFAHKIVHTHPFCAPFMTLLNEELDIELMKKGAKLFEGSHYFKNYCYRPKSASLFDRSIDSCEIALNKDFSASFFPDESFVLKVRGDGFLRGQIRIMMGTLFRLGKKEISLLELEESLKKEDPSFVKWLAPAPGLVLYRLEIL